MPSVRLATWNVNSIRARAARLRAYLAERQPDCVCLQETKVEDAGFPHDLFADLGYHVVAHGQKTYGLGRLAGAPRSREAAGPGR